MYYAPAASMGRMRVIVKGDKLLSFNTTFRARPAAHGDLEGLDELAALVVRRL